MSLETYAAEAEEKLAAHSASLPEEFRKSFDELRPTL